MNPGFLLIVGAAAVKIGSLGWLASIATSPVAVGSRKRFLEINQQGLENLARTNSGPSDARLVELRADFALLEKHVHSGWDTPLLFAAASRISTWKFYEHAYGAVTGISRLAANTAAAGAEAVKGGFDRMVTTFMENVFPTTPVDKTK